MLRTGLLLLLVALTCSFLHPATAGEKEGDSIKGWGAVTDPDADCTVERDGDSARIKFSVPGTPHDYAAELQRHNAPRVLTDVHGDFIIEVKVCGELKPGDESTIDGRRPYEGAGLLLVQDERNHLSLQRAALLIDGKTRYYLNFELRKDGEFATGRSEMNVKNGDAYLRLERRGTQVFAMTSQDHIRWRSYPPIDVNFPETIQAGVEAVSSSNEPLQCAFDELAIYEKRTDAEK
jgi:regulation of enolase protein 1 (concanavalin A-like superfamily)